MHNPRLRTPICDLLGCDVPNLSAGMGGVARSELVAAVSAAGGFGILGMVRESPDLIAQEIDAVRARSARRFAVNLIPAPTTPTLLDAELGVCFDRAVPAMCFFWDVVPAAVVRTKAAGFVIFGDGVSGGLRSRAARSNGGSIQPSLPATVSRRVAIRQPSAVRRCWS